ncbi:MAG: hypothetical protein IJP23_03630 [Oscillospiraceae bacterium]|nr:hypothetical protein [Oscillospiraceae bacterium]
MDINCRVCGRVLPEGAICCPHCGSAADTAAVSAAPVQMVPVRKGTPGGFCRVFFSALLCIIFTAVSFTAILSAAVGRSFLDGTISDFIVSSGYAEKWQEMGADGWMDEEELTGFIFDILKDSVPEDQWDFLYNEIRFQVAGSGGIYNFDDMNEEVKQVMLALFSMGRIPAVKALGIALFVISVLVAVCIFVINFRRPRNAFMYVGIPLLYNAFTIGSIGLFPARNMQVIGMGGGQFVDMCVKVFADFALTIRWLGIGCLIVGVVFVLLYAFTCDKYKAKRSAKKSAR